MSVFLLVKKTVHCLRLVWEVSVHKSNWSNVTLTCVRGQLKCDGTRAETRFRLSATRTSPFKSAGGRQFKSTTGSRGVRISGSNAGYTMFRGSVKSTHNPLNSPISSSLPLRCVTVCHHISTGLYCMRIVSTCFSRGSYVTRNRTR